MMATSTMRTLTTVATAAWLAVGGYGIWSAIVVGDEGWEAAYSIYAMALLVGAVVAVLLAARLTSGTARPRLRVAGLAVCGLGCLGSIVAWALPLWMTLLALGFGLLTAACAPPVRRGLALLTAGQLVGLAVLYGGVIAKIGRTDEYGDYPLAGDTSLVVAAALTIAGLVQLARSGSEEQAPGVPALGAAGA
jgi:hypothetical protein